MESMNECLQGRINTCSAPGGLKITDIRFAHVKASSMHCILVKIDTDQGLVGMGEVRDGASATYAAMLKSRLIGENPCDVDRLFRKIKQFGGPSRQGGGVSGIEMALWDLAGKAYGVPVYRMLGGRFREQVRVYCDLGRTPPSQRVNGTLKARAIRERMDRFGMKMCKVIVGMEEIQYLYPDEELLSGPQDYIDQILAGHENLLKEDPVTGLADIDDKPFKRRMEDYGMVQHPYTFIRPTERGLDRYEEHVAQIREELGYRVPIAIDHLGHLGLDDAKRLLRRLEKYNLMWCEDVLPCTMAQEYRALRDYTSTPLACGEDLTYVENYEALCAPGGVAVIHPDICSAGGILECKQIGNMAQKYHTAMAMHMCETPVAALATGHVGLATENFIAMEFNAPDDDYWQDLVTGLPEPLIRDGYLHVPEAPGLGAEGFNDEVIRQHTWPGYPEIWEPTGQWDREYSSDRLWS